MSKKVIDLRKNNDSELVCQRFQQFLNNADIGKYRLTGDLTKCNPDVAGRLVLVDEDYDGPFRSQNIKNNVEIRECERDSCGIYIKKYTQYAYCDR
ncbi:hypothetical protein PV-S19_0238 [Pacmanvirus S19]|nr:hypothetical protein PV-S19_0238 [Pacmanvirus S19]